MLVVLRRCNSFAAVAYFDAAYFCHPALPYARRMMLGVFLGLGWADLLGSSRSGCIHLTGDASLKRHSVALCSVGLSSAAVFVEPGAVSSFWVEAVLTEPVFALSSRVV